MPLSFAHQMRIILANHSAATPESRIRHDKASMASSHCSFKTGCRWTEKAQGRRGACVASQAHDWFWSGPLCMMCRRRVSSERGSYHLDRALLAPWGWTTAALLLLHHCSACDATITTTASCMAQDGADARLKGEESTACLPLHSAVSHRRSC